MIPKGEVNLIPVFVVQDLNRLYTSVTSQNPDIKSHFVIYLFEKVREKSSRHYSIYSSYN